MTRQRLMPSETAPHERTWMAFPCDGYVLSGSAERRNEGLRMWSTVANAISKYESLSMIVDPSMMRVARDCLESSIDLHSHALNDCWMRDIGPSFVAVSDDAGAVTLDAVDWTFNGWGAQHWARWNHDAQIGRHVAQLADSTVTSSPIVLEGGGFHVDGRGTAIMTQTVALDPERNPEATREDIERAFHELLGVTTIIWLPEGLTGDYGEFGTRGHVDILACMPDAETVLVHEQRNPHHPDYRVSQQTMKILSHARNSQGKQLNVIALPAPSNGFNPDGSPNDYSYINHYVANGAVFACVFDDPNDAQAVEILASAYPGRTIVPIQARPLFERGGGIHCITQQQPAV
ncbi:agmatine/peptidylarginine deiminase [Bifidobacterium aquikefiricola]|uniref:Agmatine deiminase family protein n=1 Tax=Bifidobacterium aquikefiricola TaxID=3059038 RepID=A0AB39U741_9BIFI